ncbi:serine carboxypeptidase S28-domain-containing protein [Suillus spraguei]|nr:serine carboxypeptidase S28-domain-containing protein [Suillus spraguei]
MWALTSLLLASIAGAAIPDAMLRDLGTFQQRYWMNWEYYEPGGPIILMTPGEVNADGYEFFVTNYSINGLIAQQQNGAAILIEHRFFGDSNPYDNLTSQSLALLTIQQAIDDLVYFATTADLPMPGVMV